MDHITHVAKEAFTRATLELAGIYLLSVYLHIILRNLPHYLRSRHLFKSSKNGAQPTLKVLDTFTPATFKVSRSLSSLTFMGMVDLLYKDFTATRYVSYLPSGSEALLNPVSSIAYTRIFSLSSD